MHSIPTGSNQGKSEGQTHPNHASLMTIRRTMAVLWTFVILTLCWMPRGMVNRLEQETSWFETRHFDKFVHAAIFTVFSILWIRASTSTRRRLWTAVAAAVLAVVTEVVQELGFIGRDGNIPDALTDLAGALAGLALAGLVGPLIDRIEFRVFRKAVTQSDSNNEPAAMHGEGVHQPKG